MDIAFNFSLDSSAKAVYDAFATAKGIQGWWCKDSNVGETPGSESLLNFYKDGNKVVMGFSVDVLEPNKRVVWTCTSNANPSWIGTQLVANIEEQGEAVMVDFKHAGFDKKWTDQPPFTQTRDGWGYFVESLKKYCESGVGQPW